MLDGSGRTNGDSDEPSSLSARSLCNSPSPNSELLVEFISFVRPTFLSDESTTSKNGSKVRAIIAPAIALTQHG
jgi:hypothetical protein